MRLPQASHPVRRPLAELLRYRRSGCKPGIAVLVGGHRARPHALQVDLIAANRAPPADLKRDRQPRRRGRADGEARLAEDAIGEGIERNPLAEVAWLEQPIDDRISSLTPVCHEVSERARSLSNFLPPSQLR